MASDIEEKKLGKKISPRALMNYAMGILWLGLGLACVLSKNLNIPINLTPTEIAIFGSACILYGLFRIYRGYRNKY
jgi:hypothetical protein